MYKKHLNYNSKTILLTLREPLSLNIVTTETERASRADERAHTADVRAHTADIRAHTADVRAHTVVALLLLLQML